MSSYTPTQQITLALVPKFSATLSFFGSGWIVTEVLLDNNNKAVRTSQNVYKRLMLGMSFYEILESVWNFSSTWPIPVGSPGIAFARGNTQTCTSQGFFLQQGLSVPIYNASLSIYYLLVIRYQISDVKLQKRVEPVMHGIAFAFPFATCMACIALDLFNNANLWCWIAPLPLNCLDTFRYGSQANCIRGDNAWVYRWAFYFVPLWMCILVAIVAMTLVYFAVRENDRKALEHRRHHVRFAESVEMDEPDPSRRESNLLVEPASEIGINEALEPPTSKNTSPVPRDSGTDRPLGSVEMTGSEEDYPIPPDRRRLSEASQFSVGDWSAFGDRAVQRWLYRRRIQLWNTSRQVSNRDFQRSHDVFDQAMWYLGAFLFTHLFSTTNRSLQLALGHTFYPLIVAHSFVDPLQGFLNFLVYRRPRYLRYRRSNPRMSRLQAVLFALQWSRNKEKCRPSSHQESSLVFESLHSSSLSDSVRHSFRNSIRFRETIASNETDSEEAKVEIKGASDMDAMPFSATTAIESTTMIDSGDEDSEGEQVGLR